MLEDSGSANGTRLNGEKVEEPEVLRDGDYITLSQVTLQFSQFEGARGEVTKQTALSEIEASQVDARTKTEAFTVKGARAVLRSRRSKMMIFVGLIAATGIGAYFTFAERTQLILMDQSSTALTYSDDNEFFQAVLGFGQYDQTHLSQVLVEFEYLGGRATLQYGAWGVDKVGELAILLNGKTVGQAPLTMNRWLYGLKIVLPKELLRKGKTNQLAFKNTRNPPSKDDWEVCYIQILQEAIPPPDLREARMQFEFAKKAWEDREIEPGNAYTALVGARKTRDLIEGLAQKPELYQEALDFIEKVDQSLTRKFDDGLFDARRAEKLDGDPEKARNLLITTRRFFRKEDFRYREIQRHLDALALP
jgi:pSer/pThr/pTyr-binding forkhead associated (FHA) protein